MRRISPTFALLVFFVIVDSLALYAAYINHRIKYEPIKLDSPVPAFVWQSFDHGAAHSIKELEGHPVVLHFWATWCPPCRDEFPRLMKAAAANPDIMFLTVSTDSAPEKPQEFVKSIADSLGIKPPPNMLYAWDPTKSITYDQFLTVSYPESIIIDAKQRQRRKYPIPVNWDKEEIRAYLKEMKEAK